MAAKNKKNKKSKKNTKKSPGLLFRNIVRTLKLFWKINKKLFIAYVLIITILAFIPFSISYIWGQVINEVVDYFGGAENKDKIFLLFGVNSGLMICEGVLWRINEYIVRRTWFDWHEYMSVYVPQKIASIDIAKLEDKEFSNFINKIEGAYTHVPSNFVEKLLWSYYQVIQVASSVFILLALSPLLLPIILLSLLPSFFIQAKSSRLSWSIWDTKGDVSREYGFNSHYLKNIQKIPEIRVYGVLKYIGKKIKNLLGDFQNEQKKIHRSTQIKLLCADLIEEASKLVIQVWMLFRVLDRGANFGIGDFTFYRNSISAFTSGGRSLLSNLAGLYDNNLFMKDIYTLLDHKNDIVSKEGAVMVSTQKVPSIEFRGVTFSYPGITAKVFDNFSIKINPGEDIALVGENGAGKTTFVKLLLRFYDIEEGEILINGVNIKDIDLESYYENIGVLFQEFNTYHYRVKENISIGRVHKKQQKAEVIQRSKEAGADDFIDKYDKKYDQMLDKSFKNGIDPSGGQWQRIALARSFYRSANILILDEPTSAIDAVGEYEIFKKILELQKEKTTIIISHRFSTVRNADKIYVIEHGKIKEEGDHESLMKIKDGQYKKMFELQAEGYR